MACAAGAAGAASGLAAGKIVGNTVGNTSCRTCNGRGAERADVRAGSPTVCGNRPSSVACNSSTASTTPRAGHTRWPCGIGLIGWIERIGTGGIVTPQYCQRTLLQSATPTA